MESHVTQKLLKALHIIQRAKEKNILTKITSDKGLLSLIKKQLK